MCVRGRRRAAPTLTSIALLAATLYSTCDTALSAFPPHVPLTLVRPGNSFSLNYTLGEIGTIPYGRKVPPADDQGFKLIMPEGDCAGVPCKTGCNLENWESPVSPADLPLFIFEDQGTGECTDAMRAYQAVRHGAVAVVIMDPDATPHNSSLVPQLNRDVDSFYRALWANIPVGRIDQKDSGALSRNWNVTGVLATLDFTTVMARSPSTVVEVWHDAADNCGHVCDIRSIFFGDIAPAVRDLDVHNGRLRYTPRYTFQTCSGDVDSEECIEACASPGRYCHLNGGKSGKAIAEENIRQLCAWQLVEDRVVEPRHYWDYKVTFAQECSSFKGMYNEQCSLEVFSAVFPAPAQTEWQACFAAMGTDSVVPTAETHLQKQRSIGVDPYDAMTIRLNDQFYRGIFDAEHVAYASCVSLDNLGQSNMTNFCSRLLGSSACLPGAQGDLECRVRQDRKTLCTDDGTSYQCACGAGFRDVDGACLDVNECEELSQELCDRDEDGGNNRNVCRNTQGSFVCEYNIPNECDAARRYGGCWTTEGPSGLVQAACQDNFDAYADAASQASVAAPQLRTCTCDALEGCWSGDGTRECKEDCAFEDCNTFTKTCVGGGGGGGSGGVATGAVVGIVLAAVFAVVLLGALAWTWRRRAVAAEGRSTTMSDYKRFNDGMDGESMQRAAAAGTLGSGRIGNGNSSTVADGFSAALQEMQGSRDVADLPPS